MKNGQRQKLIESLTGDEVWAALINAGSRHAPSLCSISQPHPGRSPISRNLRSMAERRAQAVEIEKRVHLHGLQHVHAFQLAQRGVELHVVRKQLGHARLDTTSTYIAHRSARDVGDEIKRVFGSECSVQA